MSFIKYLKESLQQQLDEGVKELLLPFLIATSLYAGGISDTTELSQPIVNMLNKVKKVNVNEYKETIDKKGY